MNGIVKRDVIERLIEMHERSVDSIITAKQEMEAARAAFVSAVSDYKSATGRFLSTDKPVSDEKVVQSITHNSWESLANMMGLRDMMNADQIEQFNHSLKDSPAFTYDNVSATVDNLIRDQRGIVLEGLARTFSKLDNRFKSHDAFKLDSRIILTSMLSDCGGFDYRKREMFIDVYKAFIIVDNMMKIGDKGVEEESETFADVARKTMDRVLMARNWEPVECEYFRIRKFKNRNIHMWLTRPELVAKVNELLLEFYGEVLPDAVTVEAEHSTELSKDLQFYATPRKAAEFAIWRNCYDGKQVLEPSAGEGGLVEVLLKHGAIVDAIEVHAGRARKIKGARRAICGNFLKMPPVAQYDAVVMNPPFYRTHWMHHVRHAIKFLKPRGLLSAILPATAEFGDSKQHKEFHKWLDSLTGRYNWIEMPIGSFRESGTNVSTVLLEIQLWGSFA